MMSGSVLTTSRRARMLVAPLTLLAWPAVAGAAATTTASWPELVAHLGARYHVHFHSLTPFPGRLPGAAGSTAAGALPDWPLALCAVALVAMSLAYLLGMIGASRREPRPRAGAHATQAGADPRDPFFVFLLPCMNEERVIFNSLQRLLSIPGDQYVVMVIDDGSQDDTAGVVSGIADDRLWLLRRVAPDAQQGKGEALNAAVRHLTDSGLLSDRDPDDVVIVVVDADGRLDPDSVAAVAPLFADPQVGAVQIGVRINNRTASRLARMQDMEFVIYTEVFQRGRRHLGSVGLGGNGQFMRLSALRSLGSAPWSRSLTEDLDLGVRLLGAGWRNEYCSSVAVHQQGVVELKRLIKQRSRWFQGHLQSWKLVPEVLRNAPRRARADLIYHLTSPAVLLIASLLSGSFVMAVAGTVLTALHGQNPLQWWMCVSYLLAFGPAMVFAYIYWLRERDCDTSLIRIIGLAHLYVGYSLMWYAAGWWAVGRTLRGQTSWVKTDRVAEAPVAGALARSYRPATVALAGAFGSGPGAVVLATADGRAPRFARTATPWLASGGPSGPRLAVEWTPGPAMGPPRITLPTCLAAVASLLAALAIVAAGGSSLPSSPHTARSLWHPVFTGHGHVAVAGSGSDAVITLAPERTQSGAVTHAALVLTNPSYRDFSASARVLTERQLRQAGAGHPNAWEVGWLVWHYTSNRQFYALTLEPTGWLLSKEDPAYRGDERFLASGTYPRFAVGTPHTLGVTQTANQITVSADHRVLTRFTDNQRPYLEGELGVYAEDSVARFSRIQIHPRSATTDTGVPASTPCPLPNTRGTTCLTSQAPWVR